jgi:hypothetical protein
MPAAETILAGLSTIASRFWLAAVGWHLLAAVLLVALARGWRPSRRMAAVLVTMPMLSVAVFAFLARNPFNGGVFAAAAVVLLGIAVRLDASPVLVRTGWRAAAGAMMIGFAWIYPHFLGGISPWAYLLASPMGLIPCPTISLVIGASLLLGGFESPRWTAAVAIVGLFYGLFGVLRLGVTMDALLTVGAVALALLALGTNRRKGARSPESHTARTRAPTAS